MTTPNCTHCNDTGKRPGSNYLDCSCAAATERAELNEAAGAFAIINRDDMDCDWFIHQRAKALGRASALAELHPNWLAEKERADLAEARIAELEAQIAAASAPVVEEKPVISSYDMEKVKKLKFAFVQSMINHGIQYNTCGTISAVLNRIIDTNTISASTHQSADTDKLREAIANISNNQITEVWESFGFQQFAHAILDLAADTVASTALQAPVREVPEGWQLVPKEPTGVMKDAGAYALPVDYSSTSAAANAYRAMLAAAPLPAAPVQKEGE